MKKNKQKEKMILVGGEGLTWKEVRDKLIGDFQSCKTEEDFLMIVKKIWFSASHSEEEMQGKRRFLGIPET